MNKVSSKKWIKRSLKSVWHPCTQMQHHETTPMISISHGKNAWIYDHEGNSYLDAISSWWVNILGHANPRINKAVIDQLKKIEHVMLAGFTHEPVIRLSEKLSDLTCNNLGHCFFASDGSSAVEIALKMSSHYWRNKNLPKKKDFVYLENSYHGETIGALGVTDVSLFTSAYGDLFQKGYKVKSPDNRLVSKLKSVSEISENSADDIKNLFEKHGKTISALIIEPLVQCAGGMVMHDSYYLKLVRKLCSEYNIHLIADEIAVGCGRTGSFFACQKAEIWPDFICLSKGLSGGYLPLSLVMTKEEIFKSFYSKDLTRGFLHSHSFTGNPLACRAALETISIFEEENFLEKNQQLSEYMYEAAYNIKKHSSVKNFRQTGMILAFDVKPRIDENFSRRFFEEALKNGLLLRPIGNTIYWMPPFICNQEEIDFLGKKTLVALEKTI